MTMFRLTCGLAVVAVVAALGVAAGLAPIEQPTGDNGQLAAPADVLVAMLPDEERDEAEWKEREREEDREHHAEGERAEEREHAERQSVARRERLLHELERKRDELMERTEGLKRKLADSPEGPARELRHELQMTAEALLTVQRAMEEVRHGERPPRDDEVREHPEEALHAMMREREELMEVGGRLRRELGELERAGRSDAAREVTREIEGVTREFQEVETRIAEIREDRQRREQPRGEGAPPEEMERRMHHVRVAVENLHAAGLHEQADQIAHQAERLLHQAGGPPREPLEGAVGDLQHQVREMRGQMEEMRRALQMLMERDRR